MDQVKSKVVGFLQKYKMDVLDVDFDENVSRFLDQMQKGLAGEDSSLEMIPTYLDVEVDVPVGKKVIAADAGGTNFRVAAIHFDEQGKPVIENLRKYSMPGIERQVSKNEFFKIMAGYFQEVIDVSENVGFCFSYPAEMQPNKDGRLIRFAKEIKAPEVVGQLVGENLNQALLAAGAKGDKHVVLLNDTVATLLAGRGYANREFGGTVGFILGTGTNCSYVEQNDAITKTTGLERGKRQIINGETGGFGQCHQGEIDRAFDQSTNNPGVHAFEKMISGAYLGLLFQQVIRQACQDELFSAAASTALGQLEEITTLEMNDFMFYPYGDNTLAKAAKQGGAEDAALLYALADRIIERAAKLTAINLSSVAIQSGQGADASKPICIVTEGTTFYKMKTLKPRTEYYLKQYLEDQRGIYTEIIGVENASLVGAAIAGLTN